LYNIGDSVNYVGYIFPISQYICHAVISSDQNFTHWSRNTFSLSTW